MRKDIEWSPRAKEDLINILDYLQKNWDVLVTIKFLDRIETIMIEIAEHSARYQAVNQNLKIRKYVITKHNTIYFREYPDLIEIVRIFDTRQDPEKLGIEKEE